MKCFARPLLKNSPKRTTSLLLVSLKPTNCGKSEAASRCFASKTKKQSNYAPQFLIAVQDARTALKSWNGGVMNKIRVLLSHNVVDKAKFVTPQTTAFDQDSVPKPGNILKKVYVPFYIFEISARVKYTAAIHDIVVEQGSPDEKPKMRKVSTKIETTLNKNLHLKNIVKYASLNYERLLVQNIVKHNLPQLDAILKEAPELSYNSRDYEVDVYTLDEESAWQIAYERDVEEEIKILCANDIAAKEKEAYDTQVENVVLTNFERKTKMLYYPMYVLQHTSERRMSYNTFVDGRTGYVAGIHHYSFLRASAASAGALLTLNTLISSNKILAMTGTQLLGALFFKLTLPALLLGFFFRAAPVLRKIFHHLDRMITQDMKMKNDQAKEDEAAFGASGSAGTFVGNGFDREVARGIDYYTVLGLDPSKRNVYTDVEIKAAFRKQAFLHHPDVQTDEDKKKVASEKFAQVNQAYQVLSNKTKRNNYHQFGRSSVRD